MKVNRQYDMKETLTKKQKAVLDFIRKYTSEHGYPPSMRDIGTHFGFHAIGTVQGYIRVLTDKGFLSRTRDKARSYTLTSPARSATDIPVLGQVAAGMPVFAPENIAGSLPCGELVSHPDETFALEVNGDSMVDAGIHDGDYVLVHSSHQPHKNDIVVARVNDEVTVKRFQRTTDKEIQLIPENTAMKPLIYGPDADISILGTVIAVYRQVK